MLIDVPKGRQCAWLQVAAVLAIASLFAACSDLLERETPESRARSEIRAAIARLFESPNGASGRAPDSASSSPSEYHVAVSGSSEGDGTAEQPWDLRTALSRVGIVKPGDIIWLHGGSYKGTFESRLRGASRAPIVVRQFPGEQAILDGSGGAAGDAVLTVKGEHTWFWGFEITNYSETRNAPEPDPKAENPQRGAGVDIFGSDIKLVNLVIHDTGDGIRCNAGARRTEIYGNLIFFNGWDGPDSGQGHGIRATNEIGPTMIHDNLIFHQYGDGIHASGKEGSLTNFQLRGNIIFMNGTLSPQRQWRHNISIGGGLEMQHTLLAQNYTYYSTAGSLGGGANSIGSSTSCAGLRIQENYLVAGLALGLSNCIEPQIRFNLILGKLAGFTSAAYADNEYHSEVPDHLPAKVLRPNTWERGKAHLVIYNWRSQETVDVNLATIGLKPEQSFVVRNVQDYFGEPLEGVYVPDQPFPIPMDAWSIAPPVGVTDLPPSTFPRFGAFLIEPGS